MRIFRIIDKIVLFAMSTLLLLDLWVWSLDSIKYAYICYYIVRWVAFPLVTKIRKSMHKNPDKAEDTSDFK